METKEKLSTIRFGDHLITFKEGETPVILFENKMEISWLAAVTVNCLRNGCPSVQMLITKSFHRLGAKIVRTRCTEPLKAELDILQLENEKFIFDRSDSGHRLLTIKRVVPEPNDRGAAS